MDTSSTHVAVTLLARAKEESDKGNLGHAVQLLESVLSLGEYNEDFRGQYPYLAAHINLYRIHHTWGRGEEALHYYAKAIVLGAYQYELMEEFSW